MALTYEIDQAAGLIRMVISGHLTMQEYQDYFRAAAEDPAYRLEMHRLVIALDVESFPSADDVRSIAKEVGKRGAQAPSSRVAVVVNSPLGKGMANMFLIQAELGNRFQYFPDEASARAWLAR